MKTYTPYTYLVGWTNLNKYYYGVRTASHNTTRCLYETGCHPDDLWVTYFTSSEHVKKFREEHGEPDVIQIRRTFNDAESAKKWEHKVLRRMKVVSNEQFINENVGGTPIDYWQGKQLSEEHRKRISASRLGYSPTQETRDKIRETLTGRKASEEHKRNMSNSLKGIRRSEEFKEKVRKTLSGLTKSEEHRKNLSNALKGRKLTEEQKRIRREKMAAKKAAT